MRKNSTVPRGKTTSGVLNNFAITTKLKRRKEKLQENDLTKGRKETLKEGRNDNVKKNF